MENMGGWAWKPYLYRWRGHTEPVEWEPVPTQRDNATISAVSDLVDCIENDRESTSSGRQGGRAAPRWR